MYIYMCVFAYPFLATNGRGTMLAKNIGERHYAGHSASHVLWGRWCCGVGVTFENQTKIPMWKFMNTTTMESHLDRIVQWLLRVKTQWEWKVSGKTFPLCLCSLGVRWVGTPKETSCWIVLRTQKAQTLTGCICKGLKINKYSTCHNLKFYTIAAGQ